MTSHDQETFRIHAEYFRRDAEGLSQIYHYMNPAFMFHMQERERVILDMLREEHSDLSKCTVLEVGCGTGHILQRFLEFGARAATGIDLMEARIEIGRKTYPNLRLDQGNAAQLPYANDSFDLVMQFMCLSSVLDPIMRQTIAAEMWRVLRPGGAILSYDLRPLPVLLRLSRHLARPVIWLTRIRQRRDPAQQPPTPIKLLSMEEIKSLFRNGQCHYRTVSLDLHFAKFAKKSYLLASLLSNVPWLRTHYLVIIRKPKLPMRNEP